MGKEKKEEKPLTEGERIEELEKWTVSFSEVIEVLGERITKLEGLVDGA